MEKELTILLVLLLSVGVTTGQNMHYNLMVYVLQWTPTFCKINTCKPNTQQIFSIHGLWPADSTGHSLTSCPRPPPAAEDLKVDLLLASDNKLEIELKAIWPNLKAGKDDREFWKYEWWKHGLCSKAALPLSAYFNAAVRVNNMIKKEMKTKNQHDYLDAGGVQPSQTHTYTKQAISSAVQKVVGENNNVYISCINLNGKILLKEIHICLDTTLHQFISCPAAAASNIERACRSAGLGIIIPI
ncbi:hypothetical protein HAX54_033571 [Datura stramonium]|uniref:Uncharacterized protein n=1 Tax=Datura stramonium TaxID=4076 RepID=A0ABS8SDI1_DATST|nr:hypothetical protein [Datura stramonium]